MRERLADAQSRARAASAEYAETSYVPFIQRTRAQVAKFVVENNDSWIPEFFKQGMADAEAGRLVDLDTALNEPYPGDQ